MKVIIGSAATGKSTILLHYVYNEVEKLLNANSNQLNQANAIASQYTVMKKENAVSSGLNLQPQPHALIITSKKRFTEAQMHFGIYCEV